MALVSLAGVNGDRGDALKRVLRECEPMSAYDMVWYIRDHGSDDDRELFRVSSGVETAQAVLRALEAAGQVKRPTKHPVTREHIWEVVDD